MNQKEFYSNYVKPYLTKDRAMNRQLYNDVKDALNKSNLVTDKQARNWCYPESKRFI